MNNLKDELKAHFKQFENEYPKYGYIRNIEEYAEKTNGSKILTFNSHNSVKNKVMENLILEEGDNILDVGCGYGFFLQKLFSEHKDVNGYGTDISPFCVENSIKNIPNAKGLLLALGERLPFKTDSFNCVVCSEVIEHVYDPDEVINEIAKVTRKGGVIILTTPNYHALIFKVFRLLEKWGLSHIFSNKGIAAKDEEIPIERIREMVNENDLTIKKYILTVPMPNYKKLKFLPDSILLSLVYISKIIEKMPFKNLSCTQLLVVIQK